MKKLYFITGTQHLYGGDIFNIIISRSKEMIIYLSEKTGNPVEFLGLGTKKEDIEGLLSQADKEEDCIGLITWMHTFSPSKMWIGALKSFKKPICHLHTQYSREIPLDKIDMDFMNLNQSAHGDREHGFIYTRMGKPRKVVAGYWKEERVLSKIRSFYKTCVGIDHSRTLKIIRFGDNMRNVAVTEGDKVEAEIRLGWSVNTHAVGDLVEYIKALEDQELREQIERYRENYIFLEEDLEAIEYQARVQGAIRKFLDDRGAKAFSNTFEDLYGMEQLPGIATQDLMRCGYGYGGEGDWKTAALVSILKTMGKRVSFMEDYTYHFTEDEKLVLGAHMLEVCPSIAATKPKITVASLGIGGKNPPARLTFDCLPGEAIQVSLIDMGDRFRLIVADCEALKPLGKMPRLPVAKAMWRLKPNFEVGTEAWILAGGAHHTAMAYDVTAEEIEDFAQFLGMEFLHIHENTRIEEFKRELFFSDLSYRLKGVGRC